jgi:hypothetical protein
MAPRRQRAEDMNAGLDGYIAGLVRIRELTTEINELNDLRSRVTDRTTRNNLDWQIGNLNRQLNTYQNIEAAVDRSRLATKSLAKGFSELGKSMAKAFANMPSTIQSVGTKINELGLFDMDRGLKKTALSMGMLTKQSKNFRDSLISVSDGFTGIGVSFEEMTEMQSQFSDGIGRAVLLTKDQSLAMARMAKATGLGADGAAALSAEFEMQGTSVEKIQNTLEQTMTDASKMGLNASKVVKNIGGNIKMLNKYNFKEGVKGLAKMAATVTKLGVEMDTVVPMAEKVFSIEGAVDLSAQLQVLGGSFAQLSDPFKLMYQGMNDIEGLTKSLAEAASAGATFNKEKDGYDLTTASMRQLKAVAEATGVDYEKLVTMGKKAAQLRDIKKQISFEMNDDTEEFIANTSFIENGKAYINIKGEKTLISQLGKAEKEKIESMIQEKKTMEQRAKDSMAFDDRIKSFIDNLKIKLLPFIEAMEEKIVPAFESFIKTFEQQKWGESIGEFASAIGSFVGSIGKFIIKAVEFLGPTGTLVTWGALKVATWFANGMALGAGFKSVTGGLFDSITGRSGRPGGGILSGLGRTAGGAASILGAAKDQFDFFSSSSARGSGFGGWLESLGGSGMSLIDWIPGLNQAVEGIGLSIDNMGTDNVALARAVYRSLNPDAPTVIPNKDLINHIRKNPDKYPDSVVNDVKDVTINDGIIRFNPRDKFMKVDDGTMIAGTNENGNKSLANAILSTKTPGFSGMDKLNQNSPNYQLPTQTTTEIELDDLNINGTIELKLNGDTTTQLSKDLLNNPLFIRQLSKMINMASANAFKGTQSAKSV